jgi:hypothetical protein
LYIWTEDKWANCMGRLDKVESELCCLEIKMIQNNKMNQVARILNSVVMA